MRVPALTLALLALAGPVSAQEVVEHYQAAMQARAAGDHETYRTEMLAAHDLEPGHAILQFHLARASALTGRPSEATDWLERALRQGAWMDPASDPWLEPLAGTSGWERILALADSVGAHHGQGRVGFELDEFDLMSEGIEFDPVSGDFFLGSVKRKILRVEPSGRSTVFVPAGENGLLVVLGLRVDVERRRLWAVSNADANLARFDEADTGRTRVHCWSLEDGMPLGRWEAPDDSLAHGFNDLALHPSGAVVVTDATAGALYLAELDAAGLEPLLPPGSLRGPNGIVLDDTGDTAWVSEYVWGITKVNLQTGETTQLSAPAGISLIGVDGLYRHGDELVAVQNYAGLDRAAAFRLDASGSAVTGHRVLEARHPRMDDPTTGVIVDGEFWILANSHIARFSVDGDPPNREDWGRLLVLRIPL